ncbi:HAMP domain-containing histidine kinase, partial [Candidatus Dojkabacteria bacterium]|nr:HAMP domain-containing histidine kinase [Candidatus Dojkabacteria bacterium]
ITIISVLLIIDILVLSNNTAEQVIKLVIFIFLTIISIILLRSIITGVEQKEELFELNKELLQSREEYISLAGEQKDIIDIMGHEIKTPLSAIIQEINLQKNISIPNQKDITNLILSKNDMQKILLQVFESLDTIDRAVDHASSLVNNMIETARIDKEKVVLNLARFDIVSLVRNIFDKITKFEESKDVSFVWRNNLGDEFYIQAHKTRIKESIESLLVNALSYGKNLNNNKSIIKLTLLKDSSYIDISIEDNGIGIDQKNIPKLGEKFMRIDSKTANVSRPGGTGLGLFVVKNIMKYHKGNLIIKSEGLGKGSTFTLRIPLKTN